MQFRTLMGTRWGRRVVLAVAGLLATWGLAWLAVPPLLKHLVEKTATERLGRRVELAGVDFRPWSLELTLHGLRVARAAGEGAQLQVRRIYIDAELQSLLRLAPVVDAVEVDEPQLHLVHQGAGRLDVDDILARLRGPADAPPAEPQRFALYNLRLTGGSLDYADAPVQRTHVLRELNLGIPFLSNLASHREVKVQPQLAFVLNGSRFDSTAQGTPFAQTRKTDASLRIDGLNLAPYLPYLPADLPVRLQAAVLDADLKLDFEQAKAPVVRLSGMVRARDVRVAAVADTGPLLAFDTLTLQLDDLRPLERVARLQAVELVAPRLDLRRDAQGRLNLDPGRAASSAPVQTTSTTPTTPWRVEVQRVAVQGGVAAWVDAATQPRATVTFTAVALEASAVQWPMLQPAQFSGSAVVASRPAQASLSFAGTASAAAASVTATVSRLPLALASPYLSAYLRPTLGGSLSTSAALTWRAVPAAARAGELQVLLSRLTLDALALTEGGTTLAGARQLSVADARIDLPRQSVNVGQLSLVQPRLRAGRDAQGRWMVDDWLKTPPADPASGPSAATPWRVTLDQVAVQAGALDWNDAARRPVALALSAIELKARRLVLPPDPAAAPAALDLSAQVGAGQAEPGRLRYQGTLALAPVQAQGTVDAADVPLHALAPYFDEGLNLDLLRADAAFRGSLRYLAAPAGPSLRVAGDAAVMDLRANSRPGAGTASLATGEELLTWEALNLAGLDVSVAPGSPTMVSVRETALTDFYARVIINEAGRINLQDLAGGAGTATSTVTGAGTTSAQPRPGTPTQAALAPVVRVGPISLVNGRVFFSDRFIKPNYSANLSELTGRLGGFSSVPAGAQPEMAELQLRGRAEGTAQLEISGRLNPLADPLALDIRGRMRDLELPPLSPYSIKYAGHGIQRGKLSMDVNYVIRPDGQLTASNRLVLNQLSFGDKVDGAPASLPVKLAVALLADRNGVIDVDLPISGSLNDPQFRLAPLIFRVIVNLVVKAVTAPFSLLAGALGGGGEELSMVAFAPGSAALGAEARAGLDKVARALRERPALRMTVVGTASLEAERDAMRRERLMALLRAEKRRAAGLTATAQVTVEQAEEPALLAAVYRRADIPKPRNLVGLARSLPPAEMQALLLANITVSEEAARDLAVQRGVAVRDYLAGRELPAQRLFLGAAKAVSPEAKWSPRAELNLATQ